MNQARVVGILGGMGPAAGADFARLFVQACAEHMRSLGLVVSDQAFPEHWLAQVPVPDRSAALNSGGFGAHQPLEAMLQALGKLAALGATSVAVACNTAHAWHGELQMRFPQLEVLHMARETAGALARSGVDEVGVLATQGTYRSGLYAQACEHAGVICHIPQPSEQSMLMRGIYEGVKKGDLCLAQECFAEVAAALVKRHGMSSIVLGCTEIPLALTGLAAMPELELIDPALVLARALANRAYLPQVT